MKRKSFQLLTTLVVTLTLIFGGCAKEQQTKITENEKVETTKTDVMQNSKLISNEVVFKDYLKDFEQFLNRKKDVATIKKMMQLKTINEDQYEQFSIALGFNSAKEFLAYATLQNQRLKLLQAKYQIQNNSEKALSNFLITEITANYVSSKDKVMVANSDLNDCLQSRTNCRVGAGAAAIVAHAGCAFVDVGSLGLLAFACHGAVYLGHEAALNQCSLNFKQCLIDNVKVSLED